MSLLKTTCLTIAAITALSFTSTAHANTLTSAVNGLGFVEPPSNEFISAHVGKRIFNSSETSTFFYRKGVRKLEVGKLEEAAYAFKASLRADGSKQLNKFTLHYLTYISNKLGNEFETKKYAKAYIKLNSN